MLWFKCSSASTKYRTCVAAYPQLKNEDAQGKEPAAGDMHAPPCQEEDVATTATVQCRPEYRALAIDRLEDPVFGSRLFNFIAMIYSINWYLATLCGPRQGDTCRCSTTVPCSILMVKSHGEGRVWISLNSRTSLWCFPSSSDWSNCGWIIVGALRNKSREEQ